MSTSLVFRVGLLRGQRAGEVQLAPRPRVALAEGSDVLQRPLEVRAVERLAERGHQAAEAARRSPRVNDGEPIRVGLSRGEPAVREVGGGNRVVRRGRGPATAVASVTGGARGLVDLAARPCALRQSVGCERERPRQHTQRNEVSNHVRPRRPNAARHTPMKVSRRFDSAMMTSVAVASSRERRHAFHQGQSTCLQRVAGLT